MMALPTVITGLLLILVGLVGYFGAEPNLQTGKVSPTALIPAAFGITLVILGGLAFSGKLRKHAMHLAALIGVLGVIGGFMPILRQINNTGTFDPFKKSAIAGELMILICAVFVGLCVRSFVLARLSRQTKDAPQSGATPSA